MMRWTTLIAVALPAAIAASCVLSRDGAYEGPPWTGGTTSGGPCTSIDDCPGDDDPLCGQRACSGGVCGNDFAPAGTDCGEGKRCDGVGNCFSCLSSQDCAPGICSNGTQEGGEVCLNGTCQPVPRPMPCDPYLCESAEHCGTSCTDESQCIQGYACAGGHCKPKGALGEPCTEPVECASGFCADGMCCDTACDQPCEACSGAGQCTSMPALQDPDGECNAPLECSGGPDCAICGMTPTPPNSVPTNPCPSQCDSCSGSTCVISCDGTECQAAAEVVCPQGWDCEVHCAGNNSCEAVAIRCPEAYDCVVDCTKGGLPDGNNRCKNAVVDCSPTGACHVTCGGSNACRDLDIHCGSNTCDLACIQSGEPLHRSGCPNNCNNCSPAGICVLL